MKYWLFKTEPGVFGIEDLKKSPKQTTCWEGVRNYQARNMLRDEIKKGDRVLFYHSQVKPMAVMGTAEVVRSGYPDHTQFDPKSRYHDPRANPDDPRWFMVDIKLDEIFRSPVTLPEMREAKGLETMMLLQKGSRLSVQPVTAAEFRTVVRMGKKAS